MKNIIKILPVLIILISCQKENFNITNLNNNKISALGHGGMGIASVYPLNSFESILNCLSIGADGTEIDIQMTKDSVLVAFHEEKLEHVTNKSGNIFNKTWAEIKGATYKEPLYGNYQVVTLDEIFSNTENVTKYTFFIDCKNFNPDTSAFYLNTFNNSLIKIIEKHNLSNNVYIEMKRSDIIGSLRAKKPNWKIFAYHYFDQAMALVNEFQLQGIVMSFDKITKEQVLEAHNNGTMVAVFNTHSKSKNIEAIEKNVDFIQSDKLDHLIKILN